MKPKIDSLEKYFTIVDHDSEKYDFVNRNSYKLVVTIGDSWTYGTGTISSLYGNFISQKLNSDWLNLARNGGDNFWMTERIEEFGKIANDTNYDTIYLICTFSETGRWFNSVRDNYINYHDWFKDIGTDYDQIPKMINNECIRRIKKSIKNLKNINLLIGTAFTEQIGFDLLESDERLAIPWYSLIAPSDGVSCYICTGGVYGFTDSFNNPGLKKFINRERWDSLQKWIENIIVKAEIRINTLSDNTLFDGTCHANADGHKIWAKYILEKIFK
jgi:hypothetical protein